MNEIRLRWGGPRSCILIRQAYNDEGLECPNIDERQAPVKLLYPRSFVDAASKMQGDKVHDYCFMGVLYRADTYLHRRWILDYAKKRFTDRSYFLITDGVPTHKQLGSFDYTNIERDVFTLKGTPLPLKGRFHDHYFRILRSSQFTLCPPGDAPWSMRFFEAIMCRSIPIVSDMEHTGRNDLERSIGYHILRTDDAHTYSAEMAEENFQTFLRHQTLIGESADVRTLQARGRES